MKTHNSLLKKLAAAGAAAVMSVTSAVTAVPSASAADLDLDNYARLLQYSLYFFDANYCGKNAGELSHFSWRDACHSGDICEGGFHDAGDHIKCGLTEGFTASTLGWMYYEYADDFKKTGTDAHVKDISDEFARFFRNSTTLDGSGNVTNFVYEIGDDGRDHGIWQNAEKMWDHGSDETYSTTNGASDVAAQYAAALAQSYINFGSEEDLKYAVALYDFAAKYRKMTTEQMTYSDKSVEDDIAWAAGWLYLATNEQKYLEANSKDTSGTNDWVNDYYYGGVWLGAALINAEITGNWTAPVNYIKSVTDKNANQFYIMNSWGSARHNTLMQTCAMVATKHKDKSGADFSDWCKKQMNYILGDNNANVCLVVGYNDVAATSPHHRSASNLNDDSTWSKWNSWDGNYASIPDSRVLYGALCGGPTGQDFSTFRKYDAKDSTSNEVALDYQIGLVGAAAGLFSEFQTGKVVSSIGDGVTVYPQEVAAANGEIVQDEKCKLSLSFVDEDGNIVPGVKAKLIAISEPEAVVDEWESTGEAHEFTTDYIDGVAYRLSITALPAGYECTATSGGYAFSKAGEVIEDKVPLVKKSASTACVTVKVEGDNNAMCYILNKDGTSLESLSFAGGRDVTFAGDQVTWTPSENDFSVMGLPDGNYEVGLNPAPGSTYSGVTDTFTVKDGLVEYNNSSASSVTIILGMTQYSDYIEVEGTVTAMTDESITIDDTTYLFGLMSPNYFQTVCKVGDRVRLSAEMRLANNELLHGQLEVLSSDVPLWGDANNDDKVDLQDAVAILQYTALPAKYPLTPSGLKNADVIDNGTSGVNGLDALAIQMVDAKLIKADKLPITKAEMDQLLSE